MATKLKVLDLSYCANLRRTPDLSAFKSLEILNLESCYDLKEIHPSICYIKTLVHLNVCRCFELKKLPARVGRMEESRELLCYDKPAQLPESIGSFESLTELYLSGTSIKELPEFIGFMEALETLDIVCCESLDHIPNSIGNLASLSVLYIINSSLREIPDSIGKLQSLVELDLSVTGITKLPESIGNLQNLRELNIEATPMTELPSAIGKLAKLYRLNASYCGHLEGLPSSIGELVSLNELYLEWSGIRSLPAEGISKLSSLRLLNVRNCQNLQEVPEPFFSLTALERPLLIRDRDYPAIRVRKGTKWRLDEWPLTTSSGTPSVAILSEEGDPLFDEATSAITPATVGGRSRSVLVVLTNGGGGLQWSCGGFDENDGGNLYLNKLNLFTFPDLLDWDFYCSGI
ncbi:hypothetical protein EUGRSUZ_C01693 [Eucalyptus grandis]|uniref:Uncharacterized protein n=2 Tax=Eucalyptus grandis TaxID=71139 RepID=A0ACC3LDR9_EUCGR|nr:hypothetical protein EUGRSUZ_C01693 [Eucalyptus grandis]